eukprot:SAG31_NODE_1977_length_6750_cov_4.507442_1_plen_261_part_00
MQVQSPATHATRIFAVGWNSLVDCCRNCLWLPLQPKLTPTAAGTRPPEQHAHGERYSTVLGTQRLTCSASLLTDVNERMIEMIGSDDQTVWELALKTLVPKLIPEIIQLQRSSLRTLALSSAPVLCSTFNLISSDAKLEDITAPSHTLIETLAKLEPIYAKLRALQVTMSSNEMKRARTQKLLDGANATLQTLDSDLMRLSLWKHPTHISYFKINPPKRCHQEWSLYWKSLLYLLNIIVVLHNTGVLETPPIIILTRYIK